MVQEVSRKISAWPQVTEPVAEIYIPVTTDGVTYRITKESLLGGILDVRVYGAKKGDSSTAQAARNTAAIQQAAAAASAAGGGLVFIPAGDWYFDEGSTANVVCQVSGLSKVAFAGAGVGVTHLHIINGADSNMFNLTGGSSYITIRDMSIDGNRAGQSLGVSGIRGDAFSGVWLQNLYIHDIYHYGIGFQGFVQEFIFMDNIKLENLGGDGFDQKNRADADLYQVASNIEIVNHGLNLAESTQAGWDCRGAWQLSNFVVHYNRTDGTGIRFRQGEIAEPDVGFGGHRSHLTNFEIYGPGAASTSTAIECVARDVMVSKGYIRDVLFGVGCYYDSLTSQGAQRCVFDSVTAESVGTAGFITSAGASDNSFVNCTALGGTYGFRIRSAGCRIVSPRGSGSVTSAISIDTAGTDCEIISPKLTGTAGAPVLGIEAAGADCSVQGGLITGHTTNVSVAAARFVATGMKVRSATGDNILVAVAGADATFIGCSSRLAASEGLQTRAARTTVIGGELLGNGGLGFQSEATASDCRVLDVYFTGNTADADDQGSNTTWRRSDPVAKSLNEAVAASGTSANLDIPLLPSTTYVFVVEANMEDSASARCTLRTKVQAYRSASGSAVVSAGTSEFSTGAGLTINLSGSGNNLRVSVTKSAGTACRLDTRVTEIWRERTVEFS